MMWNRSMIASQSVLKKSPKKGPYSSTYSGSYLECPKNDLEHFKKCVGLSKKHVLKHPT